MSIGGCNTDDTLTKEGCAFLKQYGLKDARTWGEAFWVNLPVESQKLYQQSLEQTRLTGEQILGKLKLNHSPACLNPPDLVFQTTVCRVKTASWKEAILLSVLMRRYLNEGLHVLMFFTVLVAADETMTANIAETATIKYISEKGFASDRQIVDILQRLLLHYNKKWGIEALQLCVSIIGSHPRTGYQTPPVEDTTKGADKATAIVEYIYGNFAEWLSRTTTIMQAYACMPFRCLEFQAYQVELDLAWFDAHNGYLREGDFTRRQVTGPGMLPFGLRLSPCTMYKMDSADAAEGERAAQEGEDLKPKAKRCKKGTAQEQRYAGTLCSVLSQDFAADAFQRDALRRALNICGCVQASGLVHNNKKRKAIACLITGYDAEEYRWCELDRSLSLPQLRKPKKTKLPDHVHGVYAARIMEMKKSVVAVLADAVAADINDIGAT